MRRSRARVRLRAHATRPRSATPTIWSRVETGTERLAELRDNFAATMNEIAAEEYEQEFKAAVQGRLPRFALQIEDL